MSTKYYNVPVGTMDDSSGTYNSKTTVMSDLTPIDEAEQEAHTAEEIEDTMEKNTSTSYRGDMFLVESIPEQAQLMASRINLRSDAMYQFVMIVCGFARIQVDRVLRVPAYETLVTKRNRYSGDRSESAIFISDESFNVDSSQEETHVQNMLQKPQISGRILLDPIFYSHLEETHNLIVNKNIQLKNVEIDAFIRSKTVRTYFARLIAFRMKLSGVFSGDTYHPDKTYRRILSEQAALYHIFRKVLVTGGGELQISNRVQNERVCNFY